MLAVFFTNTAQFITVYRADHQTHVLLLLPVAPPEHRPLRPPRLQDPSQGHRQGEKRRAPKKRANVCLCCLHRLQLLQLPLGKLQVGAYADGETCLQYEAPIRGKHVFLFCSTVSSNSIIQLLLSVSAARRASAKTVNVVMPYYGYSRQDMKRTREPISAADFALMLREVSKTASPRPVASVFRLLTPRALSTPPTLADGRRPPPDARPAQRRRARVP